MPDNSCRTCGGDLIRWSTCADCRKITQKICKTCCEKTAEEIHRHKSHLVPVIPKISLTTVQDYRLQKNSNVRSSGRNVRPAVIACSLAVGIVIAGIISASYTGLFYSSGTPESQAGEHAGVQPAQIHRDVVRQVAWGPDMVQQGTDDKYTYSNCIGVSNGIQMTVTCPTSYGTPYKAVVKIPVELIQQIETDIFNLREMSVTEHVDSISILYAKKTYEARFINS